MSTALIIEFIKRLIPKSRVGAWVLGVIATAIAMFLGVSHGDIKEKFCASEAVVFPLVADPMPQVNGPAKPAVGPAGATK